MFYNLFSWHPIYFGAKFVARMDRNFGETTLFYGYKNLQKSFGNIRPLTKASRCCWLLCVGSIVSRKFSHGKFYTSGRFAGKDVLELCYNSEAGLSFKEYVKTMLFISQKSLFLYI